MKMHDSPWKVRLLCYMSRWTLWCRGGQESKREALADQNEAGAGWSYWCRKKWTWMRLERWREDSSACTHFVLGWKSLTYLQRLNKTCLCQTIRGRAGLSLCEGRREGRRMRRGRCRGKGKRRILAWVTSQRRGQGLKVKGLQLGRLSFRKYSELTHEKWGI